MKFFRDNIDVIKASGLWGLLIMAAVYIVPDIYSSFRENNREDEAFQGESWEGYAKHLEGTLQAEKAKCSETQIENFVLAAELKRLRATDHASTIAIWEINRQGKVTYYNPAFRQKVLDPIGWEEDIKGLTWVEIFPDKKTAKSYMLDDESVMSNQRESTFSDPLIDRLGNTSEWIANKTPKIEGAKCVGLRGSAIKHPEPCEL